MRVNVNHIANHQLRAEDDLAESVAVQGIASFSGKLWKRNLLQIFKYKEQ